MLPDVPRSDAGVCEALDCVEVEEDVGDSVDDDVEVEVWLLDVVLDVLDVVEEKLNADELPLGVNWQRTSSVL